MKRTTLTQLIVDAQRDRQDLLRRVEVLDRVLLAATAYQRLVDEEPSLFSMTRQERRALLGVDPAAQSLGRRGGAVGGAARAAKLSPERRREIARLAAVTRWGRGRA